MGSYRRCDSCQTEYKAINDSLRAEIKALQSTDGFLATNDAIILTQDMIETLQKRAVTFRFEIEVREEKVIAQQTQIAAFFEAERLEEARLAEIAINQEKENLLRLGELEDSKAKVNKEHLVIGAAAVGVASFVI